MKNTCKKIVTDLTRDKDIDKNLPLYLKLLARRYNAYATVKVSMNFYVLKEIITEQADQNSDIHIYFEKLSDILNKYIINRKAIDESVIEAIDALRSQVERKMKNLTAYTDGYELYEYVLNRMEGTIKNDTEDVDTEQLSAQMFQFVFSDKDTVVINSKLQLLLAQLPVRMTKNKFFDIVTNTLSIYKGGEVSAVDDFCDMLRATVLIQKPDGFETEYPKLYSVYDALCKADYKEMTEKTYDELTDKLSDAALFINQEASAYMLMQEVINDIYTLLLTDVDSYDENQSQTGYKQAVQILEACIESDDMEQLPEQLMTQFMSIEGIQEDIYESVVILEAVFDDIKTGKEAQIVSMELSSVVDKLSLVSKLLSTSLFINLHEEQTVAAEIADNTYIMKLRDKMTEELNSLFTGKDRRVVRSMMSKLLSSMPIFMNSQQEIKDYFDYVLQSCQDAGELTACSRLIKAIMEDA
ncbi:MAG: hypothetical protein Q4D54_08845 [Eubacteriales bacterium]|nr:hypothetical protein [Lachnospiraceae bacterium]MDO5127840.1 hypothetical protein [Eubacteriales bacterium]